MDTGKLGQILSLVVQNICAHRDQSNVPLAMAVHIDVH